MQWLFLLYALNLKYFSWDSAVPLGHNSNTLDRSDFLNKNHLRRMLALYNNRNFVTYIMHSKQSEFGANSQMNSCDSLQR